MGRIEKTIFILLLAILLSLTAVLLVQSLSPEENEGIHSVSVLVDELGDYSRLGMDKAALDNNLDVHYVSGYGESAAQQCEYLQREIENGVDAVIVSAPDAAYLSSWLDSAHVSVPVISIGDKILSSAITSYVSPDNLELGRMLGEKMMTAPSNYPFLILLEFDSLPHILERCEGLTSAFREAGRTVECRFVENSSEAISDIMLKRRATCVAVLDETMLSSLCGGCRFYDMLFGVGYSNEIRPELESGRIQALAVYSSFDEGYVSMSIAAQAVGTPGLQDRRLDCYLVDKNSMYESPQEQILFPIS